MELLVCPEGAVPADLVADRLRLLDAAWPPAPASVDDPGRHLHDPALRPWSVLLTERRPGYDGAGRRLVACLDVLSKDVEVGGRRYAASGLSGVVTDPQRRGEGHGLRLVRATRDLLRTRCDVAVFSCAPSLVGFYAAGGFTPLPGAVLVGGTPDDPLSTDALDLVVMVAACAAPATAFTAARVPLYPGTRDRLW